MVAGPPWREAPLSLLAERVRFELTSPVKGLRFSRPGTRAFAYRLRTQTQGFRGLSEHRGGYVFRNFEASELTASAHPATTLQPVVHGGVLVSAHARGGRLPTSLRCCTTAFTDVLGFSSSIPVRPSSQRAFASAVSTRNSSCLAISSFAFA
jgi:hypothetical protein